MKNNFPQLIVGIFSFVRQTILNDWMFNEKKNGSFGQNINKHNPLIQKKNSIGNFEKWCLTNHRIDKVPFQLLFVENEYGGEREHENGYVQRRRILVSLWNFHIRSTEDACNFMNNLKKNTSRWAQWWIYRFIKKYFRRKSVGHRVYQLL